MSSPGEHRGSLVLSQERRLGQEFAVATAPSCPLRLRARSGYFKRALNANALCCFRSSSLWCHHPMTKQEAAVPWGASPHTPLPSPPTHPTTPSSARPRTCTPTRRLPPWPPCPKPWTRCRAARPATAGRAELILPWRCYRRTAAWLWQGLLRDSTATTNSSSSSRRSSSWEGSLSTTPVPLTSENSTSTPTCKDWSMKTKRRPRRGAQAHHGWLWLDFNSTELFFPLLNPLILLNEPVTECIYILTAVSF